MSKYFTVVGEVDADKDDRDNVAVGLMFHDEDRLPDVKELITDKAVVALLGNMVTAFEVDDHSVVLAKGASFLPRYDPSSDAIHGNLYQQYLDGKRYRLYPDTDWDVKIVQLMEYPNDAHTYYYRKSVIGLTLMWVTHGPNKELLQQIARHPETQELLGETEYFIAPCNDGNGYFAVRDRACVPIPHKAEEGRAFARVFNGTVNIVDMAQRYAECTELLKIAEGCVGCEYAEKDCWKTAGIVGMPDQWEVADERRKHFPMLNVSPLHANMRFDELDPLKRFKKPTQLAGYQYISPTFTKEEHFSKFLRAPENHSFAEIEDNRKIRKSIGESASTTRKMFSTNCTNCFLKSTYGKIGCYLQDRQNHYGNSGTVEQPNCDGPHKTEQGFIFDYLIPWLMEQRSKNQDWIGFSWQQIHMLSRLDDEVRINRTLWHFGGFHLNWHGKLEYYMVRDYKPHETKSFSSFVAVSGFVKPKRDLYPELEQEPDYGGLTPELAVHLLLCTITTLGGGGWGGTMSQPVGKAVLRSNGTELYKAYSRALYSEYTGIDSIKDAEDRLGYIPEMFRIVKAYRDRHADWGVKDDA